MWEQGVEVLTETKSVVLNVNGEETFTGDFSAVVGTADNTVPFGVDEYRLDDVTVSWGHRSLLSGWESESFANVDGELEM